MSPIKRLVRQLARLELADERAEIAAAIQRMRDQILASEFIAMLQQLEREACAHPQASSVGDRQPERREENGAKVINTATFLARRVRAGLRG